MLFRVPALLMSLSGPVSAARSARVPSRPQTAVIRPVMACHRARLAWHTGEISNIHLPWLLRRLKAALLWSIHLAASPASLANKPQKENTSTEAHGPCTGAPRRDSGLRWPRHLATSEVTSKSQTKFFESCYKRIRAYVFFSSWH